MEPNEILDNLIRYLKLSPKRFSEELGHNRPDRVYHVLKKRNGISTELAKNIVATFPQISYNWLISGEGKMLNGDIIDSKTEETKEEYHRDKRILELEEIIKDLRLDKERLEKDKEDLRVSRDKWESQSNKWEAKYNNLYALYTGQAKKREPDMENPGNKSPARSSEKMAGKQ